ncbi:MAG TPA: AAA family ATPase [Dehalococcoidia bacterium]|nr:AAA family ATPase [Dehalococcoidia bacterium]
MEAVILIGPQGAGKSTFYRERFFDTHVRISLDLVRTRRREAGLIAACLDLQQRFVVDNTNPTVEDRRRYLEPARSAGFTVHGYYFRVSLGECLRRNSQRAGPAKVPPAGLVGTYRKLQVPSLEEGFDLLYCVGLDAAGDTFIEEWSATVRQACEEALGAPTATREDST